MIGIRTMLSALLLGTLISGWRQRRSFLSRGIKVTVLSGVFLVCIPHRADASLAVEILLSADANAPSVHDVVAWALRDKPGDVAPLPALEATPFEHVKPLIPEPFRAEGDFKELLRAAPDSPRARLERFVVVSYPDTTNAEYVLAALREDRFVLAAAVMEEYEINSAELVSFGIDNGSEVQAGQWHLAQLNIPAAWTYNPGHALIAMLDTGLQWDHPNLRAFDGGTFAEGNYLPVSSFDMVYAPSANDTFHDDDVDELKPIPADYPACDIGGGYMVPWLAGHGTHTSGLVAAHPTSIGDVSGVCQHCSLYMMKIGFYECDALAIPPRVVTTIARERVFAAVVAAIQSGVQVINQSGSTPAEEFCNDDPKSKLRSSCLALDILDSRDVLFVASSGNNRGALNFPASNPTVIGVGGVFASGAFWDESPSNEFPPSTENCPDFDGIDPPQECGSNYTQPAGGPRQELVAGARDVLSTFYAGHDWNEHIRCTDGPSDIGTPNNGVSICTGTSMAAPIVSGIFGILRSTNPLVTSGDPFLYFLNGLRNVVASTADRADLIPPWNFKLGFGKPDAAAAVRVVLGRVAGAVVRNRATPLFGLYGNGAKDHTYTTSPQKAVAFAINQSGNYSVSVGTAVPEYAAFPPAPGLPAPPPPKAVAYVMTTPNKPNFRAGELVPLYQMDIVRNWPLGCAKGAAGCNTDNRDFLLATDVSDLEDLKLLGYRYFGREGYIYQRCSPEPGCIPVGAERLWRKCKIADDDCAVFLNRDYDAYEDDGYITTVPSGSNPILGYAYPARKLDGMPMDSDGDHLIDGFEYAVGTSASLPDTDGDGQSDGEEFPMVEVSTDDPCDAYPYYASRCPGDTIFEDGLD